MAVTFVKNAKIWLDAVYGNLFLFFNQLIFFS